jgi:hypothetical protein
MKLATKRAGMSEIMQGKKLYEDRQAYHGKLQGSSVAKRTRLERRGKSRLGAAER